MQFFTIITAVLFALTTAAASQIEINNWCSYPVYIYQSDSGSCNYGPNTICQGEWGSAPWKIDGGNGNENVLALDWIYGTSGTSVKIGPTDTVDYILQFEYDFSDHSYFDLSNLDGGGASRTGTPFANENVYVPPTSDGANLDSCTQVNCYAGQICEPAFQASGDLDVLACHTDTGDMWVDLYKPW